MKATICNDITRYVVRRYGHCVHIAYFLLLSVVGSLCLWMSPKPKPLSFTDAVFNAVSAVTETGLGSVEMHRFSLSDQITLLLLMLVGSQVFTSAIALFLKRLYPPKGQHEKEMIQRTPINMPILGDNSLHTLEEATQPISLHIISKNEINGGASLHTHEFNGEGDYTHSKVMVDNALVVMSWVTTCYFALSIMGGFLICQICLLCSPHALAVLKRNQVNSSLFALFATVSAFGNCGYILLDENLVPMQRSMLMLLCLCTLMLLGNTLYAPMLRFVICLLYNTSKGQRKQVYGYILNGTEKRYTHLFPWEETTWLVGTVVVINAFQILCILGLDWKSQALKGLGAGYKIVAALFQSIATRTGGMNVVNLSGFSTATLLISLGAMYIASYPIYLTKNQTREGWNGTPTKLRRTVFTQQLVKLRAQDSFLFLAIFLICIFERDSIKNDSINFSFFNIVFEVISGYGNVGLTIGYDCALRTIVKTTSVCMDISCGFSGRWSVRSKMVMIVVMLVGRQKGLPKDTDWIVSTSLL